jgi:hypothetical protein
MSDIGRIVVDARRAHFTLIGALLEDLQYSGRSLLGVFAALRYVY